MPGATFCMGTTVGARIRIAGIVEMRERKVGEEAPARFGATRKQVGFYRGDDVVIRDEPAEAIAGGFQSGAPSLIQRLTAAMSASANFGPPAGMIGSTAPVSLL
jgi:hypothetical protein